MTAPPLRSSCNRTSSSWSSRSTTESMPAVPGARLPGTTGIAQPHRDASQPATSWAVALSGSPSTWPPFTCTGSPRRPDTESRVEASVARHGVLRVQLRSVSPGA